MEHTAGKRCIKQGTAWRPSGQGSGVLIQRTIGFAGPLALGLVGASLMGISVASAQSYYYGAPRYYAPVPRYYNDGLAPQQVMRIVRRAGFIPLSAPARRGPNYVVVAADPAGGQVRVAVNAYEGDVISVRPVAALQPYGAPGARPYDPPPRVGALPQGALPPGGVVPHELKDPPDGAQAPRPPMYGRPSAGIDGGAPLAPPRPVPNSRPSDAPMNSANAVPTNTPPARTPIPRPRPNVAANTAASPPEAGPAAATPPAAAVPAAKPAETAPQAEATTPPAKPPTMMVPVAPLDE
jgi:hypothetical protein